MRVVFVDGSCCFPQLAPLEWLGNETLERAIAQTGVHAGVTAVSVTQAYFPSLPRSLGIEVQSLVINQCIEPDVIRGNPFLKARAEVFPIKMQHLNGL